MVMTIAVVRLSKIADMKKVSTVVIISKVRFFRVLMRLVISTKPPWASINSTIVIAPIRKTSVLHISPKLSTI